MLTVDDIIDVAANRRLYAGGAGIDPRLRLPEHRARATATATSSAGAACSSSQANSATASTTSSALVAFVDAGNVYPTIMPGFGGFKVGVGGGLRYLTPVGPIRLDVAVPLQPGSGDPSVAFYVGLGQAF